MGKHCCHGTCNSDSRYAARPEMQGVRFLPFPKPKTNLEKCRLWIKACGRKDFTIERITKDTYICTKHFVGGNGPTSDHPNPLPAAVSQLEISKAAKPVRPAPRERVNIDPHPKRQRVTERPEECEHVLEYQFVDHDSQTDNNTCTTSTQTELTSQHLQGLSNAELQDHTLLMRNKLIHRVTRTDTSCMFYTGLTLAMLTFIFDFVKDKASRLTYWEGPGRKKEATPNKNDIRPTRSLTLHDEFLLTLLRIRRGFSITTLADMFGVSVGHTSKIFCTWITFLYLELGPLLIRWPTKEQVLNRLPASFKHFKKTRCIIDCTEIFIQKPSTPSSQRITWSSYKHNNTSKLLVATSPRGVFVFLSKLWTGSISDKKIVQQSGFLDFIEYGDDVMADRGFLIRDLLAEKGATLNIPPFAHGKQLSSAATTKTRRIASARIHVERAIGRLKTFRILNGVVHLSLKPLLDQIVVVCAALCNLQPPLNK